MLCSVFVWLVILSTTRGAVFNNSKKVCVGVREEWRECGLGCAPTCDLLGEELCCEVRCVQGCFCIDAHIRDHKGRCVAVKDCPTPGVLTFDLLEVSVLEGTKVASLRVSRLNGFRGQITVRWRVAIPETGPYSGLTGVLKFEEGVLEQSINIQLNDNDVRNPDVVITIEMFEPSKKTSIIRDRMRLVIKDDDMRPGYPEMAKVGVSVQESDGVAVIQVLRMEGSDGDLHVQWRVVGVTAHVGVDFLNPTPSGHLTFEEGETEKIIQVQIVNDEVREGREDFRVELFDPDVGPGVLNFRAKGTRMTTIVHIDDDDMTPGYPEMDKKEVVVSESNGRIPIVVVRRAGVDGEITVRWRIVPGTAVSLLDYRLPVPAEGLITFPENVTEQTISIWLVDDVVKEEKEVFHVELFDPRPGPGVIKFRARGSLMTTDVIIIDDDMTPGVLELERSRHIVTERVEALRVWVGRMGGTDGEVRVHWRTASDGAATSRKRAEPGKDFVAGGGELVFKDGETRKSILVHIVDDASRESEESFVIELYDPRPGRGTKGFKGLGEVRKTTIIIHDDDMRPGLLQLELSTLSVSEGVEEVQLSVMRTGGSDGEVRVHWRTVGQGKNFFVPASGELVFHDGETKKEIFVKVVDDTVRNGDRRFEVRLFDPTAGLGVINFKGLGERTVVVITVQDDDKNPGQLVLDEPAYELLDGKFQRVKVTVLRVDGTDGRIRCRWKTSFAEEELVFEERETRKDIVIRLEPGFDRRDFELQLFDVTTDLRILNFRGLGERTTALVRLNVNPGFLDLESQNYSVPEGAGTVRVGVVRLNGSEGRVSVQWRTVSVTAIEGVDYEASAGELVFENGVLLQFISIRIIDDKLREMKKEFAVELFGATTEGPGLLNFRGLGRRRTIIIITDDDSRAGVFGFRDTHVTLGERVGHVTLSVVRREGADGLVELHWRTRDGTAREGVDFRSEGKGELRFEDKELERSFSIEILNREEREGDRAFSVGLFDPSEGASLGTDSLVTIVIQDEEDPVRIFFHNSTVQVARGSRTASFTVERSGGDISRKVSVNIETVAGGGTAKENVDYRRTKGLLHFEADQFALHVQVGLLQVDEVQSVKPIFFLVRLFDPSEGELVLGRDVLVVVITDLGASNPQTKDVRIQTTRDEGTQIDVEFRGVPQVKENVFSCPAGMTPKNCAPACQGTCPGLEPVCQHLQGGCVKGCFCPPGMLLDHSLTRCVNREQCTASPGRSPAGNFGGLAAGFQVKVERQETRGEMELRGEPPQSSLCPQGMTFRDCSPACQRTCPGLEPVCQHTTERCIKGCFCPLGMVLDHSLVRCIHPSRCTGGQPAPGRNTGGLLGGLLLG